MESESNVPGGWKEVKLEEVTEIYDSKRVPLSEGQRSSKKGLYPYCGANGIIDYIDDYIFDGEFILLAEDGGSYGKFDNSVYIMNGKFWVNNHAHILQAQKEKTDNHFLLYTLNFLDLDRYVMGTTRKKLNQEEMRKINFLLPPLPEQKSVASVLSTVDSAIQKSYKAIAKTERLKQGLMQRLLTKGIGHTGYKYSEEIGCEIPEEWEVVKIEDIAETSSGGTPSRDKKEYYGGNIPWVKSGELRDKIIYDVEEKITESGLKNSSAKIFPTGTLLIAMYGATVGKTGILGIDATTNQAVCAILPKRNDLNINYLGYSLRFRKSFLTSSSSGGAQPNISQEIIRFFIMPLPPLIEQKQISEILLTIDQKLELERGRKETFERIKKGLMDVLLSGRKRVKVT